MSAGEIVVERGGKKYIVKLDRRYTQTDEWAKLEGRRALVGITDYAQKELRDIVGVELPQVGRKVKKGEELGMLDSIKATSPYYSPLTGTVVRVNEELLSKPELLNKDPYGDGWIVEIEVSDASEYEALLTPQAYAEFLKTRKH